MHHADYPYVDMSPSDVVLLERCDIQGGKVFLICFDLIVLALSGWYIL